MELLDKLDGLAGMAALLNGLILWPTVRSLKKAVEALKEDRRDRSNLNNGRTAGGGGGGDSPPVVVRQGGGNELQAGDRGVDPGAGDAELSYEEFVRQSRERGGR